MKKTDELCPHCDNEVVLFNKFKVQKCPVCKHPILPCSICTVENSISCNRCPLEDKLNKKTFKYYRKMKEEIAKMVLDIIIRIGIDKPSNFEQIVDFIYNDIQECADILNWHTGDVDIAFRRWIEAQTKQDSVNLNEILNKYGIILLSEVIDKKSIL